ncbi:MAG: hypothetical protein E6I79_02565 [Chloroflexi bacterium]|nr:MAG: hypothetical protein E6I79_02565 [Chloroflexota bacterium]
MASEPQQTSISNQYYDLVSVLYHALESAQNAATYVRDAQGDQQLSQFFQQVQQQNNAVAQQAQQLISKYSR